MKTSIQPRSPALHPPSTFSRNRLRLGSVAAALAVSVSAQAHPGHSWFESSPSHLLMEPEHAAAMLAAGIGLAFLARVVRAAWLRRITATAGVVAFGASLIAIGLRSSL